MSIQSVTSDPVIRIYPAFAKPQENKTVALFKRSMRDVWEGLSSSRLLRTITFGVLAFGGVMAAVYLGLTPPGWITTAAIITAFALYGFLTGGSCSLHPKDIVQEISSELGTVKRLSWFGYDEIHWDSKSDSGQIFLGPMPNRLSRSNSPKAIAQREHLNAVLSINAPGKISMKGERGNYGLMQASTPTDWQEQSVSYGEIDLADHIPLSIDQLDAAADFIHSIVQKGENIYVHCKAGRSRSSMAVAAYMIKYGHLSVKDAVGILRTCRPCVKVHQEKRVVRLQEFQKFCAERPDAEAFSVHLQRAYESAYPPQHCLFC